MHCQNTNMYVFSSKSKQMQFIDSGMGQYYFVSLEFVVNKITLD